MSTPIPEDVQANLCGEPLRRPTTLSPNGEWVVFTDCGSDPDPVSVYSYEVRNHEFSSPNHAGTLGIDSGEAWMLTGEGGRLVMMPRDGK